ncbi:MAG: Fe(3+) ABC transporter substrate-binding protein [Candidatus Lambdaproteobacteria bacterium]|nr:Fe(3+) ABC transporter substrate-binding protein [Candidatus Lambdaproteobacteria bacterium]
MLAGLAGWALAGLVVPAQAAPEAAVNLYSARHYDSDKALYQGFTRRTGIRVNLIEGGGDQLIERIKAEGPNSPADVLIAADAGLLWRAQAAGILQPVASPALEQAIPPRFREPGGHWFGLTKRARVLVYSKARVKPAELASYEGLANPRWKGRIVVRSSSNVYNQSLTGALIAAHGEAATEAWARALVANFARPPSGGDRDQIRAVAAGEADVAISNTYYLGQLINSRRPEERAAAAQVAVFFPNQQDRGTHVNISGGGVARHAPNREAAVRFLDYLVTAEAQQVFARGNFEYPIVAGVATDPTIAAFGTFKEDPLDAAVFGRNNEAALKLMDRAGWK